MVAEITSEYTVDGDKWDAEKRIAADKVWEVTSSQLVPGHVFEVEADMILPCDAILLSGTVRHLIRTSVFAAVDICDSFLIYMVWW